MDNYQKITVAGLLIHGGKVLVIRRSKHEAYLSGNYELPGGKVDFGEQPEDALKREFLEETGLTIDVKKPYRVFSYISHENKRHIVEIVYTVDLKNQPDITLSEEHDDYQWITPTDIDQLPMSDEVKENIRAKPL
ncbi:MAG: NUDIX hydrolase [Nanoarchaeota archaeon]